MKTISEYKNLAVEALSGNWGKSAVATLIYLFVIAIGPSMIGGTINLQNDFGAGDMVNLILTIVLIPVEWGFAVFFLDLSRHEETNYNQLFNGFRNGNYTRMLGTIVLQGLYTSLWTLLFIIPGIVKAYSYSMTLYLMKDNPELKYDAAIEESMRIMQGHKMQLFLLDLSMIGWAILSLLTLGIGYLFLTPYNQTAHAEFYRDLVADELPEETSLSADFEEVL